MINKTTLAEVYMWGTLIGFISWDEEGEFSSFEYEQDFLHAPVEPSPLMMPKRKGVFSFRELSKESYKGLPGMLSDSLPDKFGNALIDVWLAVKGRKAGSFNPVERLCYIGERGMGALEFKPTKYKGRNNDVPIDIKDMVELASQILTDREKFEENLKHEDGKKLNEALTNLLVIGTSAGGARAKCLIAFNENTGEVRSGQIKTISNFTYWLLKLDGVSNNKDKELKDPKGFGRIEYAYHLMAKDCGIEMSDCRLLHENERAHFMTKRFDRTDGGEKLHMQSLCAMGHYDFNMAGAYSYEQALQVIRDVVTKNTKQVLEQQFRRTIFNIIGRNQDDHTKNIAFLMNKKGEWSLSPAFDVTYSFNPQGKWTNKHQMSLNGKRDGFTMSDFFEFADKADLKKNQAKKIIEQIIEVLSHWEIYADIGEVSAEHCEQ
ncbi:MAG: type II toxin-antitoxin system HipA family toxin, partial [Bacteriovorax sp.]|nr:type II toxin-antitoxin system HipA family toxin [Bacteriovorax sp.]